MSSVVIPPSFSYCYYAEQKNRGPAKSSILTLETGIMERGWDPEVKKYLKKILQTISFGLLWLMTGVTAGIYFELGDTSSKPVIGTILFYAGMVISLLLLIRYLYNTWKKD